MIRSASGDKEFWRAEAIGDATWENRSDKTDAETKKDEMAFPENIRMDALMSIGTGHLHLLIPVTGDLMRDIYFRHMDGMRRMEIGQ